MKLFKTNNPNKPPKEVALVASDAMMAEAAQDQFRSSSEIFDAAEKTRTEKAQDVGAIVVRGESVEQPVEVRAA